jgi:two-component system, cell cycle sensor histidine kinase and response regulator CckA
MQKKTKITADAAELRHRAECRLKEQHLEAGLGRSEGDTLRLVHELQVHQIELELQNEELQQARDQMEAMMEKYSDLYDFAPVGYFTLDRDGIICKANLTFAGLLGLERSRFVKRRFGAFVSPGGLAAFNSFLEKVFKGRTRELCELSILREGQLDVEVRITATVSGSGRECRAVLVDITELKRAEADRLILSKLESTGILAGGIAHDFNNLLTVILMNLELGQMAIPAGDEWAQRLEDAKKATLLARGLTQQLITFAPGGAPVMKATSLSGLIRESVGLALSGSPVRGEFDLADALWAADVDAGQIAQVIRNLTQNAREAMPQGGMLAIRAYNFVLGAGEQPSLPPGKYVGVSIADQGVGIAKELLPKIFNPYFSTKQRGEQKGMGLGLTICHSVIEKHGGAITVESTVGAGTTFRIYLPASRKAVATAIVAVPNRPFRPGRILLMDDEEDVRQVLGATLRRMGHEVELAVDGQSAVCAYGSSKEFGRPFDAVILDLTVRAGMGGQETMEALLRMDPAVKAIIMSGYANDPIVLEHKCHGFKGSLAKPFDTVKLQELIAQVMDN